MCFLAQIKTKKHTLNSIEIKIQPLKKMSEGSFFLFESPRIDGAPLSQFLDFLQCVAQDHIMSLKLKVPDEFLLLQHQGEPQYVVWPHLTEGNLVTIKPLRPHFWK